MDAPKLTCAVERRRQKVRGAGLNGIDFVEVIDAHDQRQLRVHFLGKAPAHLVPASVRIEGGSAVRDIRVTGVTLQRAAEADRDDSAIVFVDRPGDFSTYTLKLVELEKNGRATKKPLRKFDPRYASAEFSFKAGCQSELDCCAEPPESAVVRAEPEMNYLAKDYASFRQLILDRLALIMPGWQERHVPDLGITLVELLAYVGDHLSYQQDAVGTEAYLDTARRRISVRRHARLVGYALHEGCNARAWVCLETSQDVPAWPVKDVSFAAGLDRPQIAADELNRLGSASHERFQPLVAPSIKETALYVDHNEIAFYTWGDEECCLPRGATSATLRGELMAENAAPTPPPPQKKAALATATAGKAAHTPKSHPKLHLRPGDVLIFEELKSSRTGAEADADPAKRWAVRLTEVEGGEDALYGRSIVEIAWAREDALPFAFCLSARRPAPDCDRIWGLSVARGNVLLVDHGAPFTDLHGPAPVPWREVPGECGCECPPGDADAVSSVARTRVAGKFRPLLENGPLLFSQPLAKDAPASACLRQDPRRALPLLAPLTGLPDVWPPRPEATEPEPQKVRDPLDPRWQWTPRRDLLASGKDDRHFVVEMDDEGCAHLRFGDGECGRQPDAGTLFQPPSYRIGYGPAGNVGAGAIRTVVLGTTLSGATLTVRNPLPATGGTAPEPIAEAKLYAPHAFRRELQRAITGDDYARLAERLATIQRAGAVLRWTGSWFEAQVVVDPLESEEPETRMLRTVRRGLHRFRRIGHDVAVQHARYVPLEIALHICVEPHAQRGHVEGGLREVFSTRRLAGGALGFFHPDRLTFGSRIYLSQLVAAAMGVAGVESASVTALHRLGEAPGDEIKDGVLTLAALEIPQLANDPSFPDRGTLHLELQGGR